MNRVVLAVAGSRKTQMIVDACVTGDPAKRRLVMTYTLSAQGDVAARLKRAAVTSAQAPVVTGWYAFLLHNFVRPYLPLLYPGRRLNGLNFEGKSHGIDRSVGEKRFLDDQSRAYKRHLSKLAYDVMKKSKGAVVDRLERIYDEIYIDEVQDLTGYDLDVVEALLKSTLRITLVGDVRQSMFETNHQDPKNEQFRGVKMLDWFALQSRRGHLDVEHSSETWRCNQLIAAFSDTVFPPELGFPATVSRQTARSNHDGVFTLAPEHVEAYLSAFNPQCLRYSVRTVHPEGCGAINFGIAKGITRERVLIFPTSPIIKFLTKGEQLKGKSAFGLYVGVTRAIHSVAFVTPKTIAGYRRWTPKSEA